jgi:hypothetical protein
MEDIPDDLKKKFEDKVKDITHKMEKKFASSQIRRQTACIQHAKE